MHWIALRLPPEPFLAEEDPAHGAPATQAVALNDGLKGRLSDGLSDGLSRHKEVPADALADGITALGWWALQFTPKVAQLENEGEEVEGKSKEEGEAEGQRQRKSVLVLEVSASERLFGGRQQLLQQIFQSNKRFSNVLYAQAATSLIAIAKLQIKPSAFLAPSAAASLASSLASSLHTGTSASANANASARRKPGDPRDSLPNNLPNRSPKNLPESLPESLPLTTLAAAREHLPTLARIGCTTWGQLRALPRGGVVRRFGAALLDALDRAYGDKPELYPWLVLPEVLEVTLELQAQVETAPALMFSARRLLTQMQVWLQMRQCGVLAFELGWTMDARRNTATTGALTVRTAEPTRDMAHLQRLLAEHLARLTLPAPVLYLHLRTLQVEKLGADTASLLLEDLRPGDSLHQLLERLSARLGATQVRQLQAHADHRPERMQTWQSASNATQLIANCSIRTWEKSKIHSKNAIKTGNQAENHTENHTENQAANQAKNQTANQTENQTKNQRQAQKKSSNQTLQADALYPTWLLAPPLKLPVRHGTPQCVQDGGPLALLAGPQRVEAGWWAGGRAGGRAGQSRGESARAGGAGDRAGSEGAEGSENGASPAAPCALRDYFLARSEQMGLLWIYRERLGGPAEAGPSNPDRADAGAGKNADWYLHGLFA